VEIRLDMVHFLCERAEDKGEERRGGPLDKVGVRVAVSSKEERREGKEGGLVWGMRRGSLEPTECQEKEKVHSAQGRRVQHNAAATCERGPEVLTQTMFIGYAAKRLGMRSMVN